MKSVILSQIIGFILGLFVDIAMFSKEYLFMSKFKIYDENDNFIGEDIGDFGEDTKESVAESFDGFISDGILALLCVCAFNFPWRIIVIIVGFIFNLLWKVTKFFAKIAWWVLRFGAISLWWLLQEFAYGI